MHIDLDSVKNKIAIQENKKTLKSTTTKSDAANNNIREGNVKTKNNKIIPGNSSDNNPVDFTNKSNDVYLTDENEILADSKTQNLKDENKIINQHKNESDNIANGRDRSISPVIPGTKPANKEEKKEMIAGKTISKIKKDKVKWDWGLSFSVGISDISRSFLGSDFLGSGAAEKSFFADASNFSGNPQSGTDTLSNSSKKPYLIKPSLALNIGVFAAKKIFKNSSITLGVNYKSFSTSNKVGQKNDSANFYRIQNPVNRYKNDYHFIEVPVAFSLQLGKPKKMPLILNAGISVSQLIASNAVQFNNTSGIYYYDNSLFNKTQFGFSAGLYVSNKKNSILIGPHIYYGTTKIASEGLIR